MNTILLSTTITLSLFGLCITTQGQTFSEWFFQKRTRMKYLRQQAAALEILQETIREGYAMAERKLNGVDEGEQITMKLDEDWFNSLEHVKPCFRESNKVNGLFRIAHAFIQISDEHIVGYDDSEWLNSSEKHQVISDVFLGTIEMEQALGKLADYITDGKLKMTDAQRWMMIDELSRYVQLGSRLQLSLITRWDTLIEARRRQAADDDFLKKPLK